MAAPESLGEVVVERVAAPAVSGRKLRAVLKRLRRQALISGSGFVCIGGVNNVIIRKNENI